MKKGIFIIIGVAIVALVALVFLTPAKELIFGSDAAAVRRAIDLGKFEISSAEDLDRYFIFLSPDEASALLSAENAAGNFRFLMPQFDLNFDGASLVFKEIRDDREETEISYVGISGIPTGAKIYASVQGYATGEYRRDTDPPYGYIVERVIADDTGIYRDVQKNIYFSAIDIPSESIITPGLSDTFRQVGLVSQVGVVLTERELSQKIVSGGGQLALVIEKSGNFLLADFDNLLMKDGKIVMIKR